MIRSRSFLAAATVAACTLPVWGSDDYQVIATKDGKQKIIDVYRLPQDAPPKPAEKAGTSDDSPARVTFKVVDWTCGRCFHDETGRRWCLIQGPPFTEKPAKVTGWLLPSVDGKYFFLTDGGRMFSTQKP